MAQTLGIAIMTIGIISILGYVTGDMRFADWTNSTPMALNTAIQSVLIGIIFYIFDKRIKTLEEKK